MLAVMPQGRQQIRKVMIVEFVEGSPAITTDPHQTTLPKKPELMGSGALGELGALAQLLHCKWTLDKSPKQP